MGRANEREGIREMDKGRGLLEDEIHHRICGPAVKGRAYEGEGIGEMNERYTIFGVD